MYSQFGKNMGYYLELNKTHDRGDCRYTLVKDLEPLGDIRVYRLLQETNLEQYKKLQGLIWAINNSTENYPAFKTLSWELWGCGFDAVYYQMDQKELDEKLKIVDLLLGTQYWH